MLHSEEDSGSSLVRGVGAMKRACLIIVALSTSLLFFNNLNVSEAKNPTLGFNVPTAQASDMDVWWPVDGSSVNGVQPFKFSFGEENLDSFDGYWQVGNGVLNKMESSTRTYPHKEADVDLENWTWRDDNSYRVTFIAQKEDGTELARESVNIVVNNPESKNDTLSEVTESEEESSKVESTLDETLKVVEEVVEDITETVSDHVVADFSADSEEDETSKDVTETEEYLTDAEDVEDVSVETDRLHLSIEGLKNGATLSGLQTFEVRIEGMNVEGVHAYWKVGNGDLNYMSVEENGGSVTAYADIDLVNWTWRNDGMYEITFLAVGDDGTSLIEKTQIRVEATQEETSADSRETDSVSEVEEEAAEIEPVESVKGVSSHIDNPLAYKELYRAPNSNAERQADEWRNSRPEDAALMDIMGAEPQAMWIGGWGNTEADVRNRSERAEALGQTAVFVAYNIPHRDCGLYSAGGSRTGSDYRDWIRGVARGLSGSTSSVVILEPDALAGADCLSEADKAERKQLIREAIVTLKNAGAIVYVESSSPPWKSPEEMARRLDEVGVQNADGFAMNTSSYTATNLSVSYGEEISGLLGGMHFVVDTSRSGRGQTADFEWCNPSGRGLGERPTTNTGNSLVDAFLWIKSPGESDGTCNGGPSAGQWYPEQALELVKNRAF
ncbi:MAG: glycoside hydrolase family 6 protein [Candidatus Paceibacterota bacterium]